MKKRKRKGKERKEGRKRKREKKKLRRKERRHLQAKSAFQGILQGSKNAGK